VPFASGAGEPDNIDLMVHPASGLLLSHVSRTSPHPDTPGRQRADRLEARVGERALGSPDYLCASAADTRKQAASLTQGLYAA
jgi:hypothetical protein